MPFPQLITPYGGSRDLERWLREHPGAVDEVLVSTGAILFRGFDVTTTDAFHRLAAVPLGPLLQYLEGTSPRTALGGGVYTSTEYPPELVVPLHNELSYSRRWPARLAFYCRIPARTGGHTPVADSRKVYQRLAEVPELPSLVQYQRVMPAGDGFGLPWPAAFGSDDRARVEQYCREAEIETTWLPDGSLRTVQTRPAAVAHPSTAEPVWFNQVHLWHPSSSGPDAEAALRDLFDADLPMHAVLPGGEELAPHLLDAIRQAYSAETVTFDWEAGDVLLIDNMLTAHGRAPFTGSRHVLVAMGGPVSLSDVKQVTL
jgi:Taurine catabolism dioxygenase TauD, TfdA family